MFKFNLGAVVYVYDAQRDTVSRGIIQERIRTEHRCPQTRKDTVHLNYTIKFKCLGLVTGISESRVDSRSDTYWRDDALSMAN